MQVWHDLISGGDLKGPEHWGIMDLNVQGAFIGDDQRLYVFKVPLSDLYPRRGRCPLSQLSTS